MSHVPVLLGEVMDCLNVAEGERFIDATAGGGGYVRQIKKINPKAEVLAIDWDAKAVEQLRKAGMEAYEGNYADIKKIAKKQGFIKASGIVLDLGFSSNQIDDPSRGFSFQTSGPLDMRFSQSSETKAVDVINKYPQKELERIFKEFGEERFAKRIARQIANVRSIAPILTTSQLVSIVVTSLPGAIRFKQNDVLRRVFQSLRIEVNQELENLKSALPQIVELLAPGGRAVIVSFHSLEDRVVKQFFHKASKSCICPQEFPECICGNKAGLNILTRKPIVATKEEMESNPKSKSAKLRAAEKISI